MKNKRKIQYRLNNFEIYKGDLINHSKVEEDGRFIGVEISVAHSGLNKNGSIFTDDILESLGSTMGKVPIVGKLNEDRTDFLGHEEDYDIDENDEVVSTYLGQPFGLIPENPEYRVVEQSSSDGISRKYLYVKGYLWTKFVDIKLFENSNFIKKHSMELSVNDIDGFFDEEDNFVFTKAKCDGLCILGDDRTPAMLDSSVTLDSVKSKDFENTDVKEMMSIFNANYKNNEIKKEDNNNMNKEKVNEVEETKEVEDSFVKVDKIEYNSMQESLKVYDELKSKYDSLQEEYAELKEFKAGIERQEKESVLEEYKSELPEESYESLKGIIDEMDINAYEKEVCYTVFKEREKQPVEEVKETDFEAVEETEEKEIILSYQGKKVEEEEKTKEETLYEECLKKSDGNEERATLLFDTVVKKGDL